MKKLFLIAAASLVASSTALAQPGNTQPQPAPQPVQPQPQPKQPVPPQPKQPPQAQPKQPAPAPAVQPAQPAAHSLVVHVAPTSTAAGHPIDLEAMIDAPFAETLVVHWRQIGTQAWQDVSFERSSAGGWFASIPAAASPGVEYYIQGKDAAGATTDHFASEQAPHVVRVDPALFDRLEDLDRERLRGRLDEVSLDVTAHNFGNRYDLKDFFIRSEITYTHKLLRQLYEAGFGFGSITGRTPVISDIPANGGMSELTGMRYGFGQVRMRIHPSVFLDARVGLGVSHVEFKGSGAGALIFGKPWRSCVMIGGEYIGDLGGSAYVRLQWDTAPPLLMGASIVRTDLPGAMIDPAGLYIAYDVNYRIEQRFTLKAQVSYGARDGSAHFGGGLGTAVAF
ncbi:MAG TPA: hypothetical protein VL326_32360 [Kofleriaceae bacterium]|nr:hypothetical protein [Kofleriaceae bacterium]